MKAMYIVFRGTDQSSSKNLLVDATFVHSPLDAVFGGSSKGFPCISDF